MSAIANKRKQILGLVETDPDTMRAILDACDQSHDMDHRLMRMTVGVGQLAALLGDAGWTKNHLRKIFGYTVGWLLFLGSKRTTVADVQSWISAERDRQQALVIAGKLPFNCSYYKVAPVRKLRVLVEELGEVANAIDKFECARNTKRIDAAHAHLIVELTQVAAVTVAWLESLEGK